MSGKRNRWKIMSTNRADPNQGKRRKLDDYETPPEEVLHLAQHFELPPGALLEPACGSGRLIAGLKEAYSGLKITGTDIKTGHDFTQRTKPFRGHIATNPPYRDGLADVFTDKALELADGCVALLLQSGFMWGSRREERLYRKCRPSVIIVIPHRIYFFEGSKGKPIKSQYFSHAWYCWPDRATRERGDYETVTRWAGPAAEEMDFG